MQVSNPPMNCPTGLSPVLIGYLTNRNHPFGKDTLRDMLCSAYYAGMIRCRV